jgi:hydrogenase small subunit
MLGLEATAVPKIAQALEKNSRIPVIYLHLQECTCCSEGFIRSGNPLASSVILDVISLDYMEVLQASAGIQAEKTLEELIKKGEYLLVVEGSICDDIYCTVGGHGTREILEKTAKGAIAVVAYGSCATDGCVQKAQPNPTNAQPVHKVLADNPALKDKVVIRVPGCPPIPEVITGTIVHYWTFGTLPALTEDGRPRAFYEHTIHETCNRRAFFDMGLFVKDFDDEGAKKGWCLYEIGCRGPSTRNACAIIRWNDGTSYPIQSGHPCLGCSEDDFYDKGGFYESIAGGVAGGPSSKEKDYTGLKVALGVIGGFAAGGAAGTVVGGALHKKMVAASANGDTEQSENSDTPQPDAAAAADVPDTSGTATAPDAPKTLTNQEPQALFNNNPNTSGLDNPAQSNVPSAQAAPLPDTLLTESPREKADLRNDDQIRQALSNMRITDDEDDEGEDEN